jgi:hypothetical protein
MSWRLPRWSFSKTVEIESTSRYGPVWSFSKNVEIDNFSV